MASQLELECAIYLFLRKSTNTQIKHWNAKHEPNVKFIFAIWKGQMNCEICTVYFVTINAFIPGQNGRQITDYIFKRILVIDY